MTLCRKLACKDKVINNKVVDITFLLEALFGDASAASGREKRAAQRATKLIPSLSESLLSSTIDVSIESHVMGFMAEKIRRSNKKVTIK